MPMMNLNLKNEFILETINLVTNETSKALDDAPELKARPPVQSGQNYARDLRQSPGNICFPRYPLQIRQLHLVQQYPDLT